MKSLIDLYLKMVWFRETWNEEVLRQLRLALAKCQAVAFENRGAGTVIMGRPRSRVGEGMKAIEFDNLKRKGTFFISVRW